MDDEGFFQIVDRMKDMIIVSGFNVYPTEVEAVIYRHPKVSKACVVGLPDDTTGERVKAYVVAKEGETADRRGARGMVLVTPRRVSPATAYRRSGSSATSCRRR